MCKCKYWKPQFNYRVLVVAVTTASTLIIELWLLVLQFDCDPQYNILSKQSWYVIQWECWFIPCSSILHTWLLIQVKVQRSSTQFKSRAEMVMGMRLPSIQMFLLLLHLIHPSARSWSSPIVSSIMRRSISILVLSHHKGTSYVTVDQPASCMHLASGLLYMWKGRRLVDYRLQGFIRGAPPPLPPQIN